jgi:uridine kinase
MRDASMANPESTDRLINEQQAAAQVLLGNPVSEEATAKPMHLAIVGGSGAGKTWLAEKFCSALAPHAVRLGLDDFYRDLSWMPMEKRLRVNFDEPAAIDWDCVRTVIQTLSKGVSAEVPSYDFATHTRRREWRRVAPHEFIVWDGLWLLHEDWLREQFALSVFVDCESAERLARRLARDVIERGRTPESVRQQFQEQVEPMHRQHVEPQRRWASCCVVSPATEQTISRLLDRIRHQRGNPFLSQPGPREFP